MPATTQYDVVLDGHGYLIDPESYRGRLKAEFAPKTRTGDAGYGDLAGSSAWAQSDWRGGFGYEEWEAEHPTRFADGTAIDISYGDLRPGRTLALVASSPNLIAPLVIHKGILYGIQSGGAAVMGSFNGTSWAAVGTLPFAVQSLWVNGGELWAGGATTGQIAAYNGASWAVVTSGIDPDLINASGISVGFQHSYTGPEGGTSAFAATDLLAELAHAGAAEVFTPTPVATIPYQRVDAIATDGGVAWVGARQSGAGITGGLYYLAPSPQLIQRLHDNAIACFQVYRGQLYAGSYTKGMVWKVTQNGLDPFFQVPELAMSGTPPVYGYPIQQMTTDNDRLYIPVSDREGACVYQFDGVGWCRFTPALPTTAQAIIAFGDAILLATAAGIYRAVRGYAGTATLITSWFDAALGTVDKLPVRFTLTHTPLTGGQSVTIEYALDDSASWVVLGTSDTDGAAQMEIEFPADIALGTRIRFRYTMVGSTSAAPIKLRTVVFEYQLVPDSKREWIFAALCAGVPGKELIRIDGTEEPRSGGEIADDLWESRHQKALLGYTDIDGSEYRVTFEALEEEIDKSRPRAELATRAVVRLAEA